MPEDDGAPRARSSLPDGGHRDRAICAFELLSRRHPQARSRKHARAIERARTFARKRPAAARAILGSFASVKTITCRPFLFTPVGYTGLSARCIIARGGSIITAVSSVSCAAERQTVAVDAPVTNNDSGGLRESTTFDFVFAVCVEKERRERLARSIR